MDSRKSLTAGATCKESLQVHVLPDSVESALGVVALSDFPSVESVLRARISDLTRRLAEAEAAYKHVKDCLHTSQDRAQRAEERIQELEDTQND